MRPLKDAPTSGLDACNSVVECSKFIDTSTAQLKGAFGFPTGAPAAPAKPGTPARVVTINDLARFVPGVGVVQGEPDGWAVVGVPANYHVSVGQAVVQGELFNAPVHVRFTPLRYRWDYGDGTSRLTTVPGATWAQLGQRQLTATPTSHVFSDRGHRDVVVEVLFSAEYQVGDGDWIPVNGAVYAASPPASTQVVVEHTVLTPS